MKVDDPEGKMKSTSRALAAYTLFAACFLGCGPSTDARLTGCPSYPIVLSAPGEEAYSRAKSALDSLAAATGTSPTHEWDQWQGTFSMIAFGAAPLGQCGEAERLDDAFWRFVQAWPAVFQLERSEWTMVPTTDIACGGLDGNTAQLIYVRTISGGQPWYGGAIHALVAPNGADLFLQTFWGDYLPPLSQETSAEMAACEIPDPHAIEPRVRQAQLPYTVFESCTIVGSGTYTAHSGDPVDWSAVEDDPEVHWSRNSTYWTQVGVDAGVALFVERRARLIIAPENYQFLQPGSNAACGEKVGFLLYVDAVTGEVPYSIPGIYCVVC